MKNNLFQTTLRSKFCLTGLGAFTGKPVTINCSPAKADSGLVFVTQKGKVKADWRQIRNPKKHPHTTELAINGSAIITTEHILSAFYGMGVDNAIIQIGSGSSIPIFDASARFFAQAIAKVGSRELSQKRKFFIVKKPIFFQHQDSFIVLIPGQDFRVHAVIDFPNIIGIQRFSTNLENNKKYLKEISFARTFFSQPITKDRWQEYRKKFKITTEDWTESDIIVFDEKKFITYLRFPNEPVRHKILDFVGDIALSDKRIKGEAILYKPSHALNREVAKKIGKMS